MNQHQQNERTAGNASQAAVCNMLFSNISAFLRACEKSSEERRNQLYTPALIAQIVFLIKEFAELQVGLEPDFPASPGDFPSIPG